MTLLCAYCECVPPFKSEPAVFIINGQSVCMGHMDTATASNDFGRSLLALQQEQEREQRA
jgi:hypothetical protein